MVLKDIISIIVHTKKFPIYYGFFLTLVKTDENLFYQKRITQVLSSLFYVYWTALKQPNTRKGWKYRLVQNIIILIFYII